MEHDVIARWWAGLDSTQRTIVVGTGSALLLIILISFVLLGTDYSDFGEFLLRLRG